MADGQVFGLGLLRGDQAWRRERDEQDGENQGKLRGWMHAVSSSVSGSLCEDLPRERHTFLDRCDRAIQLLFVDLPEYCTDARPRGQTKRQQVPAFDDRVWRC